MESSRSTALRGGLADRAEPEGAFRRAQNDSAQVRWLRQDIASLSGTIPRIAAARSHIVALLAPALEAAVVRGSTPADSYPPPAIAETRESWACAASSPATPQQANFARELRIHASIHMAPRQSNAGADGARVGIPRRYADALLALGLMLIVAAISFTIV